MQNAYLNKSLSVQLRKGCKRRNFTLKVAGGSAKIFDQSRLIWKGDLSDGRAWLDHEHPVKRGRPARSKPRKRAKAGARVWPSLPKDDPGLASEDLTPADARGLVLTDVMLPQGVPSDFALVSLWVLENTRPHAPARAIIAELARAEIVLASEGRRARVFLSDHDRASLQRYKVAPSIVLAAAALARTQSRTR